MVIFHVHITSTFPLAVPLEWNLFMIFGMLFLFGHYGDVPCSTLDDPLLFAILLAIGVGVPSLGNLRAGLVSFLPSMRYYAGNWATSQWLFRKESGAEEKLDQPRRQVRADRRRAAGASSTTARRAELMLAQGPRVPLDALARAGAERADARAPSTTSRTTTCARASSSPASSSARTSATATSTTSSCSRRCRSAAASSRGELRVVMLESQPAHVQRQRYRIYDAADGPARGRLGQRRRHGRPPALARRAASPSRSR